MPTRDSDMLHYTVHKIFITQLSLFFSIFYFLFLIYSKMEFVIYLQRYPLIYYVGGWEKHPQNKPWETYVYAEFNCHPKYSVES